MESIYDACLATPGMLYWTPDQWKNIVEVEHIVTQPVQLQLSSQA